MTATLVDLATARGHPALRCDLEYVGLLPAQELLPLHLRREQRRMDRVLRPPPECGGWGVATDHGLALVRPLIFDTAHFGVVCADLERIYLQQDASDQQVGRLLDATLRLARRRGIQLLSARPLASQTLVVHHLLRRRFLLVDTSIELGRRGRKRSSSPPAGARVRAPSPADSRALRRVARTFVDNRFHRDPRLQARASALYDNWAGAAMQGRHGQLKVVEAGGRVAGFCTYVTCVDPELRVGQIGLAVLDRRFRGQGLFAPLVSTCAAEIKGAVVTSTQVDNTGALRAFGRLGLLPFAARQILHGWL